MEVPKTQPLIEEWRSIVNMWKFKHLGIQGEHFYEIFDVYIAKWYFI
jgi:hypothetical protein